MISTSLTFSWVVRCLHGCCFKQRDRLFLENNFICCSLFTFSLFDPKQTTSSLKWVNWFNYWQNAIKTIYFSGLGWMMLIFTCIQGQCDQLHKQLTTQSLDLCLIKMGIYLRERFLTLIAEDSPWAHRSWWRTRRRVKLSCLSLRISWLHLNSSVDGFNPETRARWFHSSPNVKNVPF